MTLPVGKKKKKKTNINLYLYFLNFINSMLRYINNK